VTQIFFNLIFVKGCDFVGLAGDKIGIIIVVVVGSSGSGKFGGEVAGRHATS